MTGENKNFLAERPPESLGVHGGGIGRDINLSQDGILPLLVVDIERQDIGRLILTTVLLIQFFDLTITRENDIDTGCRML